MPDFSETTVVVPERMSDQVSFLKARYCLSVMQTAGSSPQEEARHLIACLSTELPTSQTSRTVAIVERDALAAVLTLHERFSDRSASAVAGEWKSAVDAMMRWVSAASQDALSMSALRQ